jgi:hypothetical protein
VFEQSYPVQKIRLHPPHPRLSMDTILRTSTKSAAIGTTHSESDF